jgi:hypothetical protein
MWLKSLMTCIASLYVVVAIQTAVAAPPTNPCDFPPGLSDELSKKYPETRLVSLSDLSDSDKKLFQKDHGKRCPGLVRIDFYGDGKPTWALVLISGENPKRKAELVVAREVGHGWETRSLETTDGTPVVWRERPGKYRDRAGNKTVQATKPVIVFAGYGSWSVVYAWTGEEAEKVQITD